MSNLDLSFVSAAPVATEKEQPVVSTSKLDLGFVSKAPKPQVAEPEKPKEGLSLGRKVADFFTGNERATNNTDRLPELHNSGILSEGASLGALGTSAALTATDPNEIVKIITAADKNIGVAYDKDAQGNIFPILRNNKTGAATVINKPGVSAFDAVQALGIGAALFPASKVVAGGQGIIKSALGVGAKTAATQAAIETNQATQGGEFNKTEVAIAGAGGAVFEAVAQVAGSALPAIKRALSSGTVTQEARETFVEEGAKLGVDPKDITDEVIVKWFKDADARTGLEREFDVTLSQGSRSGDQGQLSREDSFRSGIKGEKAQASFLKEESILGGQLNEAADKIKGEVAINSGAISSRNEAGSALREGVRNAEEAASESITEAYKEVGDATLSPEGFKSLIAATKKATNGVEFPKHNVPAWEGLQKEISKTQKVLSVLEKRKGTTIKPTHIKQIESIRKAISNYADTAVSGADRRNVLTMKQGFDDFLDDAVIDGMFTGDSASLDALKGARGVFSNYMKKFGENTKTGRLGQASDGTGSFIKKIVLENPTDEQTINSLWSVSGFNKAASANMAKRYKKILGPTSDEWGMVRQAAVDQLIARKTVNGVEVVDGARTFTNLKKAKVQGESLLKEIFSAEEMSKLNRFAVLAKRSVPELVKSRENPSGTSQKLIKESVTSLSRLLPFVDMGATATADGLVMLRAAKDSKAAKKAFKPFAEVRKSITSRAAQAGAGARAQGVFSEPRQ